MKIKYYHFNSMTYESIIYGPVSYLSESFTAQKSISMNTLKHAVISSAYTPLRLLILFTHSRQNVSGEKTENFFMQSKAWRTNPYLESSHLNDLRERKLG
jgi:hypothetical protein